ncbi:uncharacterized protein CTHT_0009540 [Thermochaetoides thermophila DSM 1495]|uniref:Uncharacterized protein n=1 Tax=Chaetomium thermophilum (strain DSM 1495 / CBS 144.50 / IMI 039719) TaxID=759272 RepID=G0S0C6_CHATD|nr:hypothetical protein CTHT_0009540 [Thermochaetoides thermophila DSM 1495]EGS23287.1 hypothetical protein CTHT_0009540 [Thermochaetoides thermophila DSM 1495]
MRLESSDYFRGKKLRLLIHHHWQRQVVNASQPESLIKSLKMPVSHRPTQATQQRQHPPLKPSQNRLLPENGLSSQQTTPLVVPGMATGLEAEVPSSLEILSPPPPTDKLELRPSDLITEVLGTLARELNLEKRFKPSLQTRELRPFERGYWRLDCSSWEPELKRSAWGFLTDYLGRGAAGWGTSCRRDEAFSWIRLYCWGCVVGHMYLVLYLASRRRILHTGMEWVAGDGTAVVVISPRVSAT